MKKFIICLLCAFFLGSLLADFTLENRHAKFKFSGKNGALTGILNKETNREVAMPANTMLWKAVVLDSKGKEHTLIPGIAPKVKVVRKGSEQIMTLAWKALPIAGSKVDFTGYITLPADSGIARWKAEIASSSNKEAVWVKTLSFPVLGNMKSLGDDFMVYGDNLGRLIRTPGKRVRYEKEVPCPGHWSMQFAAFYGSAKVAPVVQPTAYKEFFINGFHRGTMPDETGLFLACKDPKSNAKKLYYNKGGEADSLHMELRHLPPLPFWPRTSAKGDKVFKYTIPYDSLIGTFSGGRGKVAALYREVIKDYPWSKNPKQSRKISENAFWTKSYGAPNKIVPENLKLQEFLRVPHNTHVVRWIVSAFDNNNLDYYPILGQMREGTRDLRSAGIGVAPYVCCAIWDSDTESYRRKNIAEATALQENGIPYDWFIRGPNPWMNPVSPIWQREYSTLTQKLFSQIFTDSQYLDVMAVGQQVCYNNNLKTINGGDYWVRGNSRLVNNMKAELKKITDEPFLVSEGFSEAYADKIDCFLIHDLTRASWAQYSVTDAFPFFTMTYNDITSIYGSDCEQILPIDFFRWQMGTSFVWGIQLCYGGVNVQEFGSVPHDIYTRNLAQAWYRVAYPYLNGGIALETAQVKDPALLGDSAFGVVSADHEAFIKMSVFLNFPWKGPAVQAMSYRSKAGNSAVIMTNITGKEQKVALHIDGNALPKGKKTLYRSWPLPVKKLQEVSGKSVLDLEIPVNDAMIIEMRAANDAPVVRDLLPINVVSMTADAKGNFAPRKVAKGILYGCDSVCTLNADGQLSMADAEGKAVVAKYFNWYNLAASNSGKGGARGDAYRRFYVLKPANITVSGDYRALIRTFGEVTSGTLELTGKSSVKTADKWQIFAAQGDKVLAGENGMLELEAGKWRILAFAPSVSADKDLVKAAAKAVDKAEKLLTSDKLLSQKDTLKGENLLAFADSVAFLLSGVNVNAVSEKDVLIPGIPLTFETAPANGKWSVLNSDLAKYITINGNTFATEGIGAANNIIRLLYRGKVDFNGKTLEVAALKYIEVMEALHTEINHTDSQKQMPIGGDVCDNSLEVTNISPEVLNVVIYCPKDSVWQLKDGEIKLTMQPNSRKKINLNLKRNIPVSVAGEEKIRIMANYSNSPETEISEEFTVISQNMRLVPAGKGLDPEKFTRKTAMIRTESMVAVMVGKDCKFSMEAEFPMRNGRFSYQLFDAGMKKLEDKAIPVTAGMVKTFNFTVPAPGLYFLPMKFPFIKLRFKGITHYVFNCGGGRQFNTFEKADKFYFMLDGKETSFEFCGIDGAPTETAETIIRDGNGSLKLYNNGRMDDTKYHLIKSEKGARGVWTLEIAPLQDFAFKMRNGVSGWVATQSAALMKTE
ncbi:MAG: hypothetical protein J6W00_09425 [Lentisphaeria bacterium]|nr:hypothetical protein [Lentisphaeria bacterium]